MNWGQAVVSTLFEDDPDSDSAESISDKDSSEAKASGPGGVAGVDSSVAGPQCPLLKHQLNLKLSPPRAKPVNISADRRSYY